jgi:hypothetical protein
MQLEFYRQIFEKYGDCEFHEPPSRERYCSMRTGGRADMKPIVEFHNFTNAPGQIRWASFRRRFLWRAVWKCGNKDYTSEIAGGRWGHVLWIGIRKKVPEFLEIDAQLDILSFFLRYELKFCIPFIRSRNPTTLQALVIALAVIHIILSLPKSGDSNSRLK